MRLGLTRAFPPPLLARLDQYLTAAMRDDDAYCYAAAWEHR
jgi:hypothetical protein